MCIPPPPPPPQCGNGIWETGEECDDGNLRDGDGCSVFCELEQGRCGDGIVQSILDEQCEEDYPPFRCIKCRYVSEFCGDGIVQSPGEQCDEGPNNSNIGNALCRLDCSNARCGDGIVDSTMEECDDGNRMSGDGCDRECVRELPASTVQLPGMVIELPTVIPTIRPGVPPAPQTPETGPGLIAIGAAGAASGLAWMRRRRGKKA